MSQGTPSVASESIRGSDQGNIYVSDPVLNWIQVFRPEGKRLYTFDASTMKAANFGHPSGRRVDAGRYLYVVDSQSNRVGLFQVKGENAPQSTRPGVALQLIPFRLFRSL
jgi:hypothetical protein